MTAPRGTCAGGPAPVRRRWGVAVVAVLALAAAPILARAETIAFALMLLDPPSGWTREDKPGVLFFKLAPPARSGVAPSGPAIIVSRPIPGAGAFDDAFRSLVQGSDQLGLEKAARRHEGMTVNGHRIVWEARCCGRAAAGLKVWDVAVGAPDKTVLLKLMVPGLARKEEEAALEAFQALVRSLRPSATDRVMGWSPAPGPFDGLYSHHDHGLRFNWASGMQEFYSQQVPTMFDKSGLFRGGSPPRGGSLAATCARLPHTCGTYEVVRGQDGDERVEMARSDEFGLIHRYENRLLRQANGITLGGEEHLAIPPVAGPLEGRWTAATAIVTNTGGTNSSAFSSRQLTLTRDGRYTFDGSYGVSGSSDAGGGTTSYAGTVARPDQDGRYKLEGYTLTLTARNGGTTVMSAFAPDPGSDGLLVLNGTNYLKDGR